MTLVLHGVRRDQFFVSQPMADGVRRDGQRTRPPVRVLPGVVAEDLFVHVPVKVERSYGSVRATERPLEQTQEVFQAVGLMARTSGDSPS